ncbi:MAG: PIN domain-containing protein [Saprospiraceae bacterium]
MTNQTRRYVFIDFENLQRIKFKKLEKVCDKVFVFIDGGEKFIPFHLVLQMQKLGKGVRWIVVDSHVDYDMNYHISFLMGQLHQKVSTDIEFAILSNEDLFDPLVDFINENERSCIRVKRKEIQLDNIPRTHPVTPEEPTNTEVANDYYESSVSFENGVNADLLVMKDIEVSEELDISTVKTTAEETIRRLIRSGNRPSEISMLKSYILLHNQDVLVHNSIDEIIQYMQEEKDIRLEEEEVIYNF